MIKHQDKTEQEKPMNEARLKTLILNVDVTPGVDSGLHEDKEIEVCDELVSLANKMNMPVKTSLKEIDLIAFPGDSGKGLFKDYKYQGTQPFWLRTIARDAGDHPVAYNINPDAD